MNTVENNNNQTAFKQVFPSYIFTDEIPEEPLALEKATVDEFRENPNGTKYRICFFNKKNISSEENYSFLVYLDNFQLTKEFRQGRSWKFEFTENEEMIRRIIFPGQTTSRSYMPLFYKDDLATPLAFTSIDPVFDLQDCRINVALDAETLYISCWVYIGKNLGDLLNNYLKPPFNSKYWLLQDPENQNLARFELTEKNKIYILPPDKLEKLPENDMLISLRTFNFVANEIGVLDEGEFLN